MSTNPSLHRSKPEILAHTSLRGIGAVGVMLIHFCLWYDASGRQVEIFDVFPNAAFILEIFFINSGFIMSYIYADSFAARIDGAKLKRFLVARLARLYPVHIVALLLIMLAFAVKAALPELTRSGASSAFFTEQNSPFTLITNVLIIHAWGIHDNISWNYPSWAVSAEVGCYLLFPFMCLMIGRWGRIGVFAMLVFSLLLYALNFSLFKTLDTPGNYGVLRCLAGFSMGVAIYRLMPYVEALGSAAVNLLQCAAILALAATFVLADGWLQVAVVFAVGLLVLATSVNRGWLSNAMSNRPLLALGRVSFTIYMTHIVAAMFASPILNVLGRKFFGDLNNTTWVVFEVGGKIAATMILALMVYRFVEIPARNVISGFGRRVATQRPSPDHAAHPVETAPSSPAAGAGRR